MLAATYGAVHDALLDTAAKEKVAPQSIRLLLAVAEHGGTIEGASHTLTGPLGSNSTAIRRSALELADAGLIANTSKRGVGMRLRLTNPGSELAAEVLDEIRAACPPPYAVLDQQEHVELREARTKLQRVVDGMAPITKAREALELVEDVLASIEGRREESAETAVMAGG